MAVTHHPDADVPARSVRVHASLPGAERRSRWASVISFVFHVLIIYLAIRLTAAVALPDRSPIGDAIRLALGTGGGGGGGQHGAAFDRAKTPPPPPKALTPVPPPPPPAPTVVPQTVTPPAPQPPAATPAATTGAGAPSAGTGTGSGGGNGTGEGPGTGSGKGPGSGSGSGGGEGTGGSPPENKQLTMPSPDHVPKELRGQTEDITFYITAAGLVSDVKIAPPIANRDFAKKFDETLRGYTFKPARDAAGNKIASTFFMQITLGSK